jgi:2-keto-3-deoxy-L-fuconate dehydrogenase
MRRITTTGIGRAAKRVLIPQSDAFMGPVLCESFSDHGAVIVADTRPLSEPELAALVMAAAGYVDILIASLAMPAPTTAATELTGDE